MELEKHEKGIHNDVPNLFIYTDFRKYLKDYYDFKKVTHPQRFSYRNFSRLAGFQSQSFMHMVIKGKRNLSSDSIQKLVKYLKFDDKETDYFSNLVLFNQAETHADKAKYFEVLASTEEFKSAHFIRQDQSLYLTQWYYPVVREMINLSGFQPKASWVASRCQPKITEEEAQGALDLLIELELAMVDDSGKWHQVAPKLETCSETTPSAVMYYHQKMIENSLKCLDLPSNDRDVSGMTMSITSEKKDLILKKISLFKKELQDIITQSTRADSIQHEALFFDREAELAERINDVYQFNFQFFKMASDQEAQS